MYAVLFEYDEDQRRVYGPFKSETAATNFMLLKMETGGEYDDYSVLELEEGESDND